MSTEQLQENPFPGVTALDYQCIQTIRFLSMEGVQAANAGHPGMPMGCAPAAYTLFTKTMKHNPENSSWINRDRFVLSAGHGSMLLYSMLHLCGYDLSMDDLKQFRQWGSKTPGHPEYGFTDGVELTTGPLGQGISSAVGMAIASKYAGAYFNREGFDVIDYNIQVISGDGCLQEGISSEASSLAGHLGLDNLILTYDDNHITIDGDTDLSFTEDVAKRYESYGWYVQIIGGDGNDMAAYEKALENAKNEKNRPSIIQLRTHIGYGSPNKQDSHAAHGAALGEDEIDLIKENANWPKEKFYVPIEVTEVFTQLQEKGANLEADWNAMFANYKMAHPDLAQAFEDALAGKFPVDIESILPTFEAGTKLATRQASGKVLDAIMPRLPLIMGGSADLTPSNNTQFTGVKDYQKDSISGRYIRYGVREHAMGAILNGINISGLLRAYAATFFCFADYMRPSIRLAALSHYPTPFVFTHDSIGLGEDGPTHQPVEHMPAYRAIPHINLFRPADANETAYAWKHMLENTSGPSIIVLTRQGLPVLDQDKYGTAKEGVAKGGYVLISDDNPVVQIIATGSEVELALNAYESLTGEGIATRVISLPCFSLFEAQDKAYRDSVILPNVKARCGVEAGVSQGWDKYIGDNGEFVGMTSFGASAKGPDAYKGFGITTEAVIAAAKKSMVNAS